MGLLDNIFGKAKEVTNLTNLRPKRLKKTIDDWSELTRAKQDIGTWRRSILYAESKSNPNREAYYRMLKDVVVDSHLSAIIEQRKNGTLCREVCYYNADGTENEEVSNLFEKTGWFIKMRSMMLDAKFYGFTLIDLGELVEYGFPTITEVERQYVKPELGIVVSSPSLTTGISLDDPRYNKWNIFIGETHDLGLLMKAAPWALWKKTVTAYWSEYCEKFGMPMRIGKTNVNDDALRDNMHQELKNMGAAFSAVLNTDDEIQILETFSTAAYDIYDKFIDRANSEMSKLILSQTGTTDEKSFAGSAGVHQDVLGALIERDVMWQDAQLNEVVKPVLIALGFPLPVDGYFETGYEEKASLKEKAEMVIKMMPYVNFKLEYLNEEFGLEIESLKEANKPKETITNATRRYYDSL